MREKERERERESERYIERGTEREQKIKIVTYSIVQIILIPNILVINDKSYCILN